MGQSATTQYGNIMGGGPNEDVCPDGQALSGFEGSLYANTQGQIRGVCSIVHLASDLIVTTSPGDTLPLRGLNSDMPWTRTCSDNQVIVGFEGRAGDWVDQLVFHCAPLSVSGQPGAYAVTIGTVTLTQPIGGAGGNAFPATTCMDGQIATVARIRSGTVIDAFGLGCSTPVVVE
jgi:hypothetical protein